MTSLKKNGEPRQPKTPQTLDRFPEIDFVVFRKVANDGYFKCEFDYKDDAMAMKFRYLRLVQSLKEYRPHDPLTIEALKFSIKLKDRILIVEKKDESRGTLNILAALNGTQDTSRLATDTDEQVDLALDDLSKELIASGSHVVNRAGQVVLKGSAFDDSEDVE